MPRQRMIRPDFFASESLADCSIEARLAFIGLWTLADDAGNAKYQPRRMAAQLFPFDGIDADAFGELVAQLEAVGCVKLWEQGGQAYITVSNFETYQKVNRPSKSNIPRPPEDVVEAPRTAFLACSKAVENQLITLDSVSAHGALTPKERKKEVKRESYIKLSLSKEGEVGAAPGGAVPAPAPPRHRACGTPMEFHPWDGSWLCPSCNKAGSRWEMEDAIRRA